MKKIRVFIADDHPVLRDGLKATFSQMSDFDVAGEAQTGAETIEKVASLKPDVIIMDITMPDIDGITATRRITEASPEAKIVILSMHTDVHHAIDAFRAGATAYVLKDSRPEELLHAVRKVVGGEKYASPSVAEGLLNDFVDVIKKGQSHDPFDSLSDREKEVLALIADGATSKEIGEKLFISVSTVKSHRNNIMKKLNLNDMAGLIKMAIRKGIIKAE